MIFEVQVISLWNKAGNIIGHVLLSNDKTSVKETEFRTEENKKNLEMAMEAANMSSWVYDVRKKTFSSLHGTSIVKEKMTLDELSDILHPQDREQLQLVIFTTNKIRKSKTDKSRYVSLMKSKSNIATMKAGCAYRPNTWGNY